MSDTVLVAILGLIGSGVGSLIGVIASSKLTQYRIEQLERKVEAHNNLVVRTYELEGHMELVDNKIENINHEVERLESFHHE